MSKCKGKSSWPELVWVSGIVAEKTIEKENRLVKALIVEEGSVVTADFRCDRVFVWVEKKGGLVTRTPHIGKSSWPELVGQLGTDAERIIEKENPLVNAVIVDEGSSVLTDFRCDWVWVWVDKKTGIVTRIPFIG